MSKAGKYRQQIAVFIPATPIADDFGGFISDGETSMTIWARVQEQQAKDEVVNGKVVNRKPFKITVRAGSEIQSAQRLQWNGTTISVASIVTDEKNAETTVIGYAIV